jgi:hypothetical protein
MPFFARDTSAILRFVFAVIVLSSSLHLTAQVALLPRTAYRFVLTKRSMPGNQNRATALQQLRYKEFCSAMAENCLAEAARLDMWCRR